MKVLSNIVSLTLLFQFGIAHYVWTTLLFNESQFSRKAVRRPRDVTPISSITSMGMRCNLNAIPATETIALKAGSVIGFKLDKVLYHQGPAAMYLGKAPFGTSVTVWDGSGPQWFKIEEWGAVYEPFTFSCFRKSKLITTIPLDTPPGEYLVRIEHLAMHRLPPEAFVSCAQINITEGGTGNPPKIAIPGPGYIDQHDPKIKVDIYWPVPTSYVVPGPRVWRGNKFDRCL